MNLILKIIIFIIFISFFSLKSYSKNIKPNVSIPFITLLDQEIDNKSLDNFKNLLKNELKKNNNISFIDLDYDFYSKNLLNSDQLKQVALDNSIDFIITGSVTKFKFGIVFNLKLLNTVNGNILLTKQYIVNKHSLEDFIIDFEKDLNKIINENNYVVDLNNGNAEIRVNTLPKTSSVSLNNNFLGKTPLIIKGAKNDINKLEIYNEEDLLVKKISIYSNDDKIFFTRINNKEYITSLAEIRDELEDNYNLEIYSNLDNNKNKRNKELKTFKLEIVTEPENLKVLLNNRLMGNTPIILDILEGKHNLKISKNRTIVFNEIVNSKLEPKKFVNIHLYKLSKLYLESNPNNASIYIDNIDFGLTPKYINIPFGYHKLAIKKNGFNQLEKDIFIEYPNNLNLSLELESLKNLDTSVSFFPTAITNNFLNLNLFGISLGQLSDDNKFTKNLSYLYGSEINYGINSIFNNDYFSLGAQIGLFYNNFGLFSNGILSNNYGIAGKIKFLEQNNFIPVSLAIGGFYKINNNNINNYIVITRDFDWFYFSFGTHFSSLKLNAINFNFSLKNLYKINIGLVSLIDFGLMAQSNQYLAPLIGLNIGYNFL